MGTLVQATTNIDTMDTLPQAGQSPLSMSNCLMCEILQLLFRFMNSVPLQPKIQHHPGMSPEC